RTVLRLIGKTISATASHFREKLNWPTDEQFEEFRDAFRYYQNPGFEECVLVVDGTEIRISRPSKTHQREYYSGKKKQHSVNLIIIILLDGQIVYCSPISKGAHDQRDWNKLNLREKLIGKKWGIMGDAGFTFNK